MEKEQFPPKEFADLVVALYKMRKGKDVDAFAKDCLRAVREVMPTVTAMTKEPVLITS